MGLLAEQFEDIKNDIPNVVNRIAIETAIVGIEHAVIVTPADTSKLLSNWRIGLDVKPIGDIVAHSVGKAGSSRSNSASETVSIAKAILATKKPGQNIYLSNATPYIGYVNDGTETIAARNFVESTQLAIDAYVPTNGAN